MKTATTFFGIMVAVLAVTALLFSAVLFGYRNEYSIRSEELAKTVFDMAKALDQNSETNVSQEVSFEPSNPAAGIPDSGKTSSSQFHTDMQIGGTSYEGFERFYKQLLAKREDLDQPDFKKRLLGAVGHAKSVTTQRDRLAAALKEASRILTTPEISEEKLRTQKVLVATVPETPAASAAPAPADGATPPPPPPAADGTATPPPPPGGAAAATPPPPGGETPAAETQVTTTANTSGGKFLYEEEIAKLLGFLNSIKERDDNLIQYLVSIADAINIKADPSLFKVPDEQGRFEINDTLKKIFNQVSAVKRRADDTTATLYESASTLQTAVLNDDPIDWKLRNPDDLKGNSYKAALTAYQADIREAVARLNSINALRSDITNKEKNIDTLRRLNVEKDGILNDELKCRKWYAEHFGGNPITGDPGDEPSIAEAPPPIMPVGYRSRILRWDASNGFAVLGCAKSDCKHDPRKDKFCEACGRRQGVKPGMIFLISQSAGNGKPGRLLGRLKIDDIQRDSCIGIWSNPYDVNVKDIKPGDAVMMIETTEKPSEVELPDSGGKTPAGSGGAQPPPLPEVGEAVPPPAPDKKPAGEGDSW